MRKKGISPIIATVLIIAITIGAGVVLYAMVQPLIKTNIGKAACTQVTFELDLVNSCKVNANNIKVSIDRTMSTSDEPEVVAWKVIVGNEGEKKTIKADWTDIVPGVQLTKSLPLPNLDFNVENIYVYPIIKVENNIEECTIIQKQTKLFPCSS